MTEEDFEVFNAKLLDSEPDRSKIKWRKIRKIPQLKRKRMVKQKINHPGTEEAHVILEEAGRSFDCCEECGKEVKTFIHHIDGNPYNNELSNLRILYSNCHGHNHSVEDADVIDEEWSVPLDDEI